MACKAATLGPLLIVLLVTTGLAPALAWSETKPQPKPQPAPSTTTNVACSAGLVAVKLGEGIICVAGAGGSNYASGNQIASGNGKGGATDTTTAGNGGSITGRKMLGQPEPKPQPAPSSTTNVACSAGLVAIQYGKGIICVAGAGGSNIASGNQIASGNGKGGATDTTTAGNGGSITGRKMLGDPEPKPQPAPSSTTNVACSAGLVAVKFGKGIICVAGAGGDNVLSGNQVLTGNSKDSTTAGSGGSITG